MNPTVITTKGGLTATLYCADCMDVLPTLGKVDAVVTDPPYGINGGRGGTSKKRSKGDYEGAFTAEDDTPEFVRDVAVIAIRICIEKATAVIVTPGCKNFCLYPQPDSFGTMWQPAASGFTRFGFADSQPIFYYGRSYLQGKRPEACSIKVHSHAQNVDHPCPKPPKVVEWMVAKAAQKGATILDPFMGSGTTGVAALRMGCNFIGVELSEQYYKIAKRRIQAEAAQGDLFRG